MVPTQGSLPYGSVFSVLKKKKKPWQQKELKCIILPEVNAIYKKKKSLQDREVS